MRATDGMTKSNLTLLFLAMIMPSLRTALLISMKTVPVTTGNQ